MGMQQGHDDDASGLGGGEHTHTHAHAHSHKHMGGGCIGFIMNILGLDRYTKGKATTGLARASSATNPFDLGCVGNCKDFWTTGRELGVEYEVLYEVPLEGFRAARARRGREEGERGGGGRGHHGEDGGGYLGRRKGKGLWMGMGLGRTGGSREGYQPIRMDDQV